MSAEAFAETDLRAGRVLSAAPNRGARTPAYVLRIDFGPLGERTSSAQLADHYAPDDLVGCTVIAAVNLGARRIAGVSSEVLVLGVPDADGRTVLLAPERPVPPGGRVH